MYPCLHSLRCSSGFSSRRDRRRRGRAWQRSKMMEGAVVVPFTLEDLEGARLLLARLPGWEGTLEDASVALLALRLKAPVWTLNYRDLGAFPALRFWTP